MLLQYVIGLIHSIVTAIFCIGLETVSMWIYVKKLCLGRNPIEDTLSENMLLLSKCVLCSRVSH
jgi:hypothetical protein